MRDRITAPAYNDQKLRQTPSRILRAGDPVILDGGTLGYFTGYTVGGTFEVRIGGRWSATVVTVPALVPTTEEDASRDRAEYLTNQLVAELSQLYIDTADKDLKDQYDRALTRANRVREILDGKL